MGIVGVLVVATLNDGEVLFVTGQRGKALSEFVAGPRLREIREPGFLGHAEAEAKEDHALGRQAGLGGGCGGKAGKAKGLKSR